MELNISEKERQQFILNMKENKETLSKLRSNLLIARKHDEEIGNLFKSVHDRVLKENEYYQSGERICDSARAWCLSDEDFQDYIEKSRELEYLMGYVDKYGNTNPEYERYEKVKHAENELINFQLSLFPKQLREKFKYLLKNNSAKREEFIKITMETR